MKSGFQCSGYDTFREHREVRWKVVNKSHIKSTFETENAVSTKRPTADADEESPRYGVAQCREQQAIYFYFGQIQPRLLGYWTDDLGPLYLHSSPSSILTKTTSALCLSITSLHPLHAHFKPLAMRKYTDCLRLVREAFDDPNTAAADETLIAVLLLGTYEVGLRNLPWYDWRY